MPSMAGMGEISRQMWLADSWSGKKGKSVVSHALGPPDVGGSGASARGLYPVNIYGVS